MRGDDKWITTMRPTDTPTRHPDGRSLMDPQRPCPKEGHRLPRGHSGARPAHVRLAYVKGGCRFEYRV